MQLQDSALPATAHFTSRLGSTAKVLANCKLKYHRISECISLWLQGKGPDRPGLNAVRLLEQMLVVTEQP